MKILLYLNVNARRSDNGWYFSEYFPIFWINLLKADYKIIIVVSSITDDFKTAVFYSGTFNGEVISYQELLRNQVPIIDSLEIAIIVVPSSLGKRISVLFRKNNVKVAHYIRGNHLKSIVHRHWKSPALPLYILAAFSNELWLKRLSSSVPTFFVGEQLKKRYKGSGASTVIYVNNIQMKKIRISAAGPVQPDLKFIYVGRFTREKGVHRLPSFFRWMTSQLKNDAGLSFTIIGDGPDKTQCIQELKKIQGLKIEDIGHVSDSNQILDHYNKSHYLISLPFTEGLPKTLIESQSQGCVPIFTDVGSISTVMVHRHDGLIVDPKFHTNVSPGISYEYLTTQFSELSSNANKCARNYCYEQQAKNIHGFIKTIL